MGDLNTSLRSLPQAGRYGCLLADPPWSFLTYSGEGTPHRTEDDHYGVLGLDALKAMAVGEISAPDAALFMWILDTHFDQAVALGRAWGFEYVCIVFIWQKMSKNGLAYLGMGYWSRKQAEVCLLFTRGNPKRLNADVRQKIDSPVREHSRKPEEQYRRIERLVAGPRLELFARQQRDGWDVWGNQTGKFGKAA